LYEIIPAGVESEFIKDVDPLKYQKNQSVTDHSNEMVTVKLRYKAPDRDVSKEISRTVTDEGRDFDSTSDNFRFSAAVGVVGMILRDSKFIDKEYLEDAIAIAKKARGKDEDGYRAEFVRLAKVVEQQLEGLALEDD
jgi:Ca-activated chloride channel family protein